jgi:negative regulator of flagellin synthesis FlgM
MKIPSSLDLAQAAAAAPAATTDRSATANARTSTGGVAARTAPAGTSVSISQLSVHLHALETSLATGEAFDGAKVDRIKAAIRDGSLKVNPEAIADKMLAAMRDTTAKAG